MSSYSNILLEKKNGTGRLVINRPPYNIIDLATILELNRGLGELRADDEVKVVVITAAGSKAFSAGVEIKDHIGGNLPKMANAFMDLFLALIEVDKPTIAVVNGMALGGGCEIVAGCDMAVASEKADFGQPEIKLGVYPPPAAILLPRKVGMTKACEIILSGDKISAREAERIGLINKAVPDDELEKAADEFIKRFTSNSGLALTQARRAILRAAGLPMREAIEVTRLDSILVGSGENAVEGLTAFVEKRKPNWKR